MGEIEDGCTMIRVYRLLTAWNIKCVCPVDFPTHVFFVIVRAMISSVHLGLFAEISAILVLVEVWYIRGWGRGKRQMNATVTMNGRSWEETE